MLKSDYLKKSHISPDGVSRLNGINVKAWHVYNALLSSNFLQRHGGFEFVMACHFGEIGILEAQYLCKAFAEIDNLVRQFQEKQVERDRIIKDAEQQIKKQQGR